MKYCPSLSLDYTQKDSIHKIPFNSKILIMLFSRPKQCQPQVKRSSKYSIVDSYINSYRVLLITFLSPQNNNDKNKTTPKNTVKTIRKKGKTRTTPNKRPLDPKCQIFAPIRAVAHRKTKHKYF